MRRFILLLLCAATGAFAAPPAPNIVLITVDTVRADRMGFLGSTRGLTPQMDALARAGIVFERAYSQAPLTTVSHATILSGTFPTYHGVEDFGMHYPADVPHLAEILRGRGYHTAAFVGALILDPYNGMAPGFERGFETYEAGFTARRRGQTRYESFERRAEDVVGRALAWMKSRPNGPFFVWVHVFDPHKPYDPPAPYARRYTSAPYDGEIAYTDAALGKLFAELRGQQLFDGALIVLAGDHGEGLGDHGERTHGIFLYDATIHVPLLVKLPQGVSAGGRVRLRAQLVDIAPTILEVAGVPKPAVMQGLSLLRLVGKNPPRELPPAYSETQYPLRAFGWSALAALRTDKYLYVRAPRRELYDTAADPKAARNLASSNAAVAEQLTRQMENFQARSKRTTAAVGAPPLDPRAAETLSSLGYVAGVSRAAVPSGKLADPKDKIEVANTLHDAMQLNEDNEYQRAIVLLKKVLTTDPQIFSAYMHLGNAYVGLEDFASAIPPLRKAVELAPENGPAHYTLGKALLATGDLPGAAVELESAVKRVPKWVQARFLLATVYAGQRKPTQAIAELQRVVEVEPKNYNARLLLGRILAVEGQPAAGLPHLEQAVALRPESAEAHAFLADAYRKVGRTEEAAKEQAEADRLKSKRVR